MISERVITVRALSVAAVKGTRLRAVQEISLGPRGAEGNRRLFVIDNRDRMVNAKQLGDLQTVVADLDADRLTLRFPDGSVVDGPLRTDARVAVRFFSRTIQATVIDGPFAAALSDHVGQPLRLAEAVDRVGVDRGAAGAVTLLSRASLARLAAAAGVGELDGRRFRMLVEVDGVAAHGEDRWVGRRVRLGGATVAFAGHVGRCLVTSRDPDSGRIDLPTLDVLRGYRDRVPNARGTISPPTEPLPFGVYGAVIKPGRVRLGDPVVAM